MLLVRPTGRNAALHKPVAVSSVRLGDPRALVNGFVEYGGYALHTKTEPFAWVRVDLESPRPLSEIRLYARGDGYYDLPSARIDVGLSEDGLTYRRAGRCADIFTQLDPCVIDATGEPARYVLVSNASALVLSEIEAIEAP